MIYVYNSQLDAFTLYHISQEESASQQKPVGPALPALGHATSGAAGTAISKLITYPLDLVITRLQVQKQFQTEDKDADYDGILDAIQKIYQREGGIKAFYSGVSQETLKGVADSFLFFLAYTLVRQQRLNMNGHKRSLPALDEIGVGVIAGAFAKFITSPIQNIVTRKQTAAMVAARDRTSSVSPELSTKDIALQIRSEKGFQGFWSGYSASLVLTLNPAFTFLLHKMFLRLLVPRSRRQDPGARITFLIAAISKALASTITYPFSLAKTRAQVSQQKPSETTGPTSETEKLEEPIAEAKVTKARRHTVFSTILRIARTEGLGALYQGLGAEVLKGFFSHGITMLMKERIHILVINLYYLVLRALKKYPSPEELATIASEQAKEAYESGKEQVGDALSRGVQIAESASQQARETLSNGKSQAEDLIEKGKGLANNTSRQVQDTLAQSEVTDIEKGESGNKG